MSLSMNPVVRGGSGGFDPAKMASMMASKMMSDLDPTNTGKVTKDQFVAALTSKGMSSADATKMYDAIDTKGTGSFTKSDLEAAIQNGKVKPPSGGAQGGPRGAGGPGGAGGPAGPGGAGKSGGVSGSSTTYAAADTNQDGVVSAEEAAIYALKHPSAATTNSTTTDPSKLGKNIDEMV